MRNHKERHAPFFELEESPEMIEQKALLKAFTSTVYHFFGSWQTIFAGIRDPRNSQQLTYPLAELLCTGVLMFVFRLGARRQINYQLRGNGPAQDKLAAWFGTAEVAHGDTLNYVYKRLAPEEVQEVVCRLVTVLLRKKVLERWRLFGDYLIVVDGTGMLTYRERHCAHCLTRLLNNGQTLYYHPILEAKLVTHNGFAFSVMTEFMENTDPSADKQDCELKAFYRLTQRLKARFPRLPICLLLDGLFAGGPTFQICTEYNWHYLIVLQEADLPNIHRSCKLVASLVPENHKRVRLGQQQAIVQNYRWVTHIEYTDTEQRSHCLHVLTCEETRPNRQGTPRTTTFKWLTNLLPTMTNVDTLANQGGRLRWKIENEGFNIQKNAGYNLEHPYSQDATARKVFYFLLQIACLLFQLLEKGSLFRQAFPKGVGSLKNIALRLLEAWRNLRLNTAGFCSLYSGRYQIRFDSS